MIELNWDKSFALKQTAGDAVLLQELLQIFKISLAEDLEKMQAGVLGQSTEVVREAAHSIKGAAASLGFTIIVHTVTEVERADSAAADIIGEQLSILSDLLDEVRNL